MGRLDGKVALIIGGSGQGRSHALALASECAAVVLIDNLQGNARLLDRLGARYLSTVGDVRSPSDLARTASEAIDAFGRLDIAVCNAGVALGLRSVLDTERAARQLVHDINLTGVFNMVQWFCRHTASKWGVIGLVKTVAVEYGMYGIRETAFARPASTHPCCTTRIPMQRSCPMYPRRHVRKRRSE